MSITLGIDDEDSVNVVQDLERSFDIRISASEAAACHALGDIFDLLRGKLRDSGVGGKSCASAMAFYRLRHAIADLSPEERLRPSTPLAAIERASPKGLFKYIHAQTGLQLPSNEFSWIG